MDRLEPDFANLLEPWEPGSLDRQTNVIYGTWRDYRLAYMNPAWFAFARENGGEPAISEAWGLGRSIADSWPAVIQECLHDRLQTCLNSGLPYQFDYECSSDQLYRHHNVIVYPLPRNDGLLFVNSARMVAPHRRQVHAPGPDYVDETGLIVQCAHCRRVKNRRLHEQWDWVPALVAAPAPRTSHALCDVCFGYYYPP